MPPRFMQRMQKQSDTLLDVFGPPTNAPPPYAYSTASTHSRTASNASSMPETSSSYSTAPPAYQRTLSTRTTAESPCLPKGATVLVIGASGWLGSHVVDQLLKHGYTVRGAVRDNDKAMWTTKTFSDRYGPGKYTAVVVPDMAVPGAYNQAVKNCSGVIHVASVTSFSADPHQVISPTITGAMNALESASREPNVCRFVYCSSLAAATTTRAADLRHEVSHRSWNMEAFQAAWSQQVPKEDRSWAVFASSKLQAEQTVWKWYKEKQPNFVLNCVLPGMLFGPPVTLPQPSDSLPMHILKTVYASNTGDILWVPPQHFADVQDAALIHVAALILPGLMNERLFVAAAPFNLNGLTQLLRGIFPEHGINGWVQDHGFDQTTYTEASRAEQLLRRMGKKGWTDIETSVSRACASWT